MVSELRTTAEYLFRLAFSAGSQFVGYQHFIIYSPSLTCISSLLPLSLVGSMVNM